jgi:hypothetical protein
MRASVFFFFEQMPVCSSVELGLSTGRRGAVHAGYGVLFPESRYDPRASVRLQLQSQGGARAWARPASPPRGGRN